MFLFPVLYNLCYVPIYIFTKEFLRLCHFCQSLKESVDTKVIIEKSRGEVSLVEQDTIENVS